LSAIQAVKIREVTATTPKEAVDYRQFVNSKRKLIKGTIRNQMELMNHLSMMTTSYESWAGSEPAVSVNCDLSFVVNLSP